MNANILHMILMDDVAQQLRKLNQRLETGLPAPQPVTVITQPAAQAALPAPQPTTLLPVPTTTSLPVGPEETRRFLLSHLLAVSTGIQNLSLDFKAFSEEFDKYTKERRARGRVVADTETIDDQGRTIEVSGGMLFFRAINKGSRYGVYVMLNDQYPGEWRGPGEEFVALYPTRAIIRVRLFCNNDESTRVEYFGLF